MSKVYVLNNFALVLLRPGDRYGRDFCLTLRDRPEVEFWDLRYQHGPITLGSSVLGQFTGGRYYADDIAKRDHDVELRLDIGVLEWTVPASDMRLHVTWLREQLEGAMSDNPRYVRLEEKRLEPGHWLIEGYDVRQTPDHDKWLVKLGDDVWCERRTLRDAREWIRYQRRPH